MRLKPQIALAITLVIFIGGIVVVSVLGLWQTESDKIPQRLDQGESAGQYDANDIRGSYSFGEISKLFDIPLADLAAAFSVPSKEADTFLCKDLEAVFAGAPKEIGTDAVRMFVAFYKGLPYDLTKGTYLPEQAAKIILQKGQMTAEQQNYLPNHTVAYTPSK